MEMIIAGKRRMKDGRKGKKKGEEGGLRWRVEGFITRHGGGKVVVVLVES